jgi:hypothetical protein
LVREVLGGEAGREPGSWVIDKRGSKREEKEKRAGKLGVPWRNVQVN